MSLHDAMTGDLEVAFSDFGEPAIYTPSGGDPIEISAIVQYGEDLDDAQWRAALQASAFVWIRKANIPDPSTQDTIQVEGVTWMMVRTVSRVGGAWKFEFRRDLRPTFRK